MKAQIGFVTLLVPVLLLAAGCSDDEDGGPTVPTPGRITARAEGIQGQATKGYAVFVYDYDWYPGAQGQPVGKAGGPIMNDDFSFMSVVQAVDAEGRPTGGDRVFDPGDYSVVFFVGPGGSPPESFAESRIALDGDVTVSAPPWGSW